MIEKEAKSFFQSKATISANNFESLCYLATHIIFILSSWGMSKPNRRNIIKILIDFIAKNMWTVIEMNHTELVGEFVDVNILHSVHILKTSYSETQFHY